MRVMSLKDQLRADLTASIKSRDEVRSSTLRMVLTAVSLVVVNYPNLFSTAFPGAHFPNQPLIDALHGADISGIASVLVAAGSYIGLRKVMA